VQKEQAGIRQAKGKIVLLHNPVLSLDEGRSKAKRSCKQSIDFTEVSVFATD
jgi:hypothetical protein